MATGHPRPLPGYPTTLALYPVSVRRIRAGGIGFLQIPPRDGHPCLALRFGPSPPAEDLHLLKQNIPGTQKKLPLSLGKRERMRKQQGKPSRNRPRTIPESRRWRPFWGAATRGRTGSSPAHPFGNLATIVPRTLGRSAQGAMAHGFASPPHGGFALSRMKGVAIQARREGLPPKPPQYLAASLLCNSRLQLGI
jgi:hypothetical protein